MRKLFIYLKVRIFILGVKAMYNNSAFMRGVVFGLLRLLADATEDINPEASAELKDYCVSRHKPKPSRYNYPKNKIGFSIE